MGVRHAREYSDILTDLKEAIKKIEDSYTFFEMTFVEWHALSGEEQLEVLEALADDVFFGLGEEPELEVGTAKVIYNKDEHKLEIKKDNSLIAEVSLI